MSKIILNPTETSQWHELLKDAQLLRETELTEEIESYMIFLLMRFMSQPEFTASVLALEYLDGHACSGSERVERLRDVGDKCLLFSGLFPHNAERKRVTLGYYIDLGQGAYHAVSQQGQEGLAALYTNLRESFVMMMDTLHAIREIASDEPLLLPLEAQDLWERYQSEEAFAIFSRHFDGVPSNSPKKKNH